MSIKNPCWLMHALVTTLLAYLIWINCYFDTLIYRRIFFVSSDADGYITLWNVETEDPTFHWFDNCWLHRTIVVNYLWKLFDIRWQLWWNLTLGLLATDTAVSWEQEVLVHTSCRVLFWISNCFESERWNCTLKYDDR